MERRRYYIRELFAPHQALGLELELDQKSRKNLKVVISKFHRALFTIKNTGFATSVDIFECIILIIIFVRGSYRQSSGCPLYYFHCGRY